MENTRCLTGRGKAVNNDETLIGKRFGRLVITGFQKKPRVWLWNVVCDCGNVKTVRPSEVKSGKIRSCGCLHDEAAKERATKFRNSVISNKRLYNIYNKMKRRCCNSREARYSDYGGRGISVCGEWMRDFDVFADWARTHGYTDGLTLERKDVNGDYCPENCCWITLKEQNANKRDTVYVTYNGERVKLMDLAKDAAVSYDTLHNRIRGGWDVGVAITEMSTRKKKSLKAKCEERGIKYATVLSRINRHGWSEEEALTTPLKKDTY